MPNLFICKICGASYQASAAFGIHISKTHHISPKDYYDTYINASIDKKCIFCESERKFISISKGYHQTCGCISCGNKLSKQTKLITYGNENYRNDDKIKATIEKKYGHDFYSKISEKAHEKLKQLNYHKGDRPPAWNKGLTKETSESMKKVSESLRGKLIGPKNGMYGKQHDSSSKIKMSKNHSAPKLHRFYFNDIGFDSKLEIEFYKLFTSMGLKCELLNQSIKFNYLDKFDMKHTYRPDFIVNGRYIEIKTKAAFNEFGILFNHRTKDRSKDYIYEAKFNCMKENKIIIFTENDLNENSILEKLNEY